jgi:hypothetical protein
MARCLVNQVDHVLTASEVPSITLDGDVYDPLVPSAVAAPRRCEVQELLKAERKVVEVSRHLEVVGGTS